MVDTMKITDEMVEAVRDACEGCGCDECCEKVRAALTAALTVEQEPFGYFCECKGADPAFLRKPAYIPPTDKFHTTTPLYAAPVAAPVQVKTLERDKLAYRFQELMSDLYIGDDEIEGTGSVSFKMADYVRSVLVAAPSRDDVVRECMYLVEQNVLEFTNRERCVTALRALISGDTSNG